MPLDVLSKIQSFAEGGNVDAQRVMSASAGLPRDVAGNIASAVVGNGVDIDTDTLSKVASLMSAVQKATERAGMAALGLQGAFNGISQKPLERVEGTLDAISDKSGAVTLSVETSKADASLGKTLDMLRKLQENSSVNVRITSSVPSMQRQTTGGSGLNISKEAMIIRKLMRSPLLKSQKFATGGEVQGFERGGRITYHRQNTETAQRGGVFRHGSSTGDRNMIFANRGEGIITERAMRQGARQHGMSTEAYIQALNHPSTNLGRVKRGRSFKYGGTIGGLRNVLNNPPPSTVIGNNAKLWQRLKTELIGLEGTYSGALDAMITEENLDTSSYTDQKDLNSAIRIVKELERKKANELRGKSVTAVNSGQYTKETSRSALTGMKSSLQQARLSGVATDTESHREKFKDIAAGVNAMTRSFGASKIGRRNLEAVGISDAEGMMQKLSQGVAGFGGPGHEKDYEEALHKMHIAMQATIVDSEDLKEDLDDLDDEWDKEIKNVNKVIKSFDWFGKLSDENSMKLAVFIAGFTLAGKKLKEFSEKISDFVTKQAELSKNFTIAAEAASTFSGTSVKLDTVAKSLNLSREQAAAFGKSMQDMALYGENGVGTVSEIAGNLKNALGKVDTTMLKEAVDLIKDLPKEQVEVLIHGKGTFDDKANLIANLMNSNDIEKTINLMMNGAFGKKEGSVQLDEKDKAVIEAQERGNLLLDEIRAGIYSLIPQSIASDAAYFAKILGSLGKEISTLYTLYMISRNVARIALRQTGSSGGDILGRLKNIRKSPTGGPDSWSNAIPKMKKVLGMKGLGAGFATTAIVAGIGQVVGKTFDAFAKRNEQKKNAKYHKDREKNIETYGNSVGRENLNTTSRMEQQKAVGHAVKNMGMVAGAAMGLFVAFGALTLGVGTAAGAIAMLVAGIVAGLNNNNDPRSSFTHEDKRNWFTRMFGSDYSVNLDKDAEKRMANFAEMLDKMDARAKEQGKKTGQKLLLELVALNKHVKSIERVVKSKYTAFEENSLATDMSLLEQNAKIGGTKEEFMGNKERAFGANMRAYATQTNALSQQMMSIFKDDELGSEAKANAVNKLIQEETKMHNKFIDNMTKLVNTIGETPEIIVSNLRQKINESFNNLLSEGYINNSGIATETARGDMAAMASNFGTLFSDYTSTNREITATMRTIDANIKKNDDLLRRLQRETGISSDKQARENLDTISAKMRDQIGATADLASLADMFNEISTKAADANASSDQTTVSSAAAEFKTNLDQYIAQLQTGINMLSNSKKPEDRKAVEAMNAQMGKLLDLKQERDSGASGEDFDKKVVNTIQKFSESGSWMKHITDEIEKAMESLSPEERERFKNSREYETLARAIASLNNTKVAAEKLRSDAVDKFVTKIGDQTKKFITSLSNVLDNGAIKFAKAMKEVFEQSEEYDLFGGATAAFNTLDASISELEKSLTAVNDAKELVGENDYFDQIESAMNEYFKETDNALRQEEGSLAELSLVDIENDMYKELCAFHEEMISKEENEKIRKADEEFGAALRAATGDNFKRFSNGEAQALGFSNLGSLQTANDQQIGEAFRKWEDAMVEEEKRNSGVSLTDEQARQRARARAKDEFGDNAMLWVGNEAGAEQAYDAARKKYNTAVETAHGAAERRRSALRAEEHDTRASIHEQVVAKYSSEKEQVARKILSNDTGKEYMSLIMNTERARQRYMQNPNDRSAKNDLDEAERIQRDFEDSNFSNLDEETRRAVMGMASTLTGYTQSAMKVAQAEAQWKQKFMQVFNSIPKLLEKVAMNSGRALALGARQGALESKQTTMAQYGNVGAAIGMRGASMDNAGRLLRSRMENLGSDEMVKEVENAERRAIEMARQSGASEEKLANMQIALHHKVVQAKYEAEKKAKDEYVESLRKSMESVFDAISTREEGLNIEKELYETIGAPFEYILDVEQDLVRAARDKAAAEEEILAQMEKDGITGLALEKQKNKVAKASAEVIKASFGAQRDALDKLLGKMMGGFEQIGGIFGPDSDFMKARKAGQGYTQLPSGMISASGGTVTDYANRVQQLGEAAGMHNGVKTQRGQAGVFGGGIPQFASGGLVGDWVSNMWHQLKEGMNNSVGSVSGDSGYGITENGNKVKLNRKEAIFNYDTLTALAKPLGETPEQYVAEALSGNPYRGLAAADSWTNMDLRTVFGHGRNRFRKYDDTTTETVEDKRRRETQEARLAALALGMEYIPNSTFDERIADSNGNLSYQRRNGMLLLPGEDGYASVKDANGNSVADDSVKQDATSAATGELQNSAFGGLSDGNGGTGGASATATSADKLLLAILEDTHKMVELMGGKADWKKYKELSSEVNKKDEKKKEKTVKGNGEVDEKTVSELKKENRELYGKKGKTGRLSAEKVSRISENNDKIAGHAYDSIATDGSEEGEGKKPLMEEALDTDKDILKHVILIYELLKNGVGVPVAGSVPSVEKAVQGLPGSTTDKTTGSSDAQPGETGFKTASTPASSTSNSSVADVAVPAAGVVLAAALVPAAMKYLSGKLGGQPGLAAVGGKPVPGAAGGKPAAGGASGDNSKLRLKPQPQGQSTAAQDAERRYLRMMAEEAGIENPDKFLAKNGVKPSSKMQKMKNWIADKTKKASPYVPGAIETGLGGYYAYKGFSEAWNNWKDYQAAVENGDTWGAGSATLHGFQNLALGGMGTSHAVHGIHSMVNAYRGIPNTVAESPVSNAFGDAVVALGIAATTWDSLADSWHEITEEEYHQLVEKKRTQSEFGDFVKQRGKNAAIMGGLGAAQGFVATGTMAGTMASAGASLATLGPLAAVAALALIAKHFSDDWKMQEFEENMENEIAKENSRQAQKFANLIASVSSYNNKDYSDLSASVRGMNEMLGRVHNDDSIMGNWAGSRNKSAKHLMTNDMSNADANMLGAKAMLSLAEESDTLTAVRTGDMDTYRQMQKMKLDEINTEILELQGKSKRTDSEEEKLQSLLKQREDIKSTYGKSYEEVRQHEIQQEQQRDLSQLKAFFVHGADITGDMSESDWKEYSDTFKELGELKKLSETLVSAGEGYAAQRGLTPEEQKRFDELNQKMEGFKARGATHDNMSEINRRLNELYEIQRNGGGLDSKQQEEFSTLSLLSSALREIDNAGSFNELLTTIDSYKAALNNMAKDENGNVVNWTAANASMQLSHMRSAAASTSNLTKHEDVDNTWMNTSAHFGKPNNLAVVHAQMNGLNAWQALDAEVSKALLHAGRDFVAENAGLYGGADNAAQAYNVTVARHERIRQEEGNVGRNSISSNESARAEAETETSRFLKDMGVMGEGGKYSKAAEQYMAEVEEYNKQFAEVGKRVAVELGYNGDEWMQGKVDNAANEIIAKAIGQQTFTIGGKEVNAQEEFEKLISRQGMLDEYWGWSADENLDRIVGGISAERNSENLRWFRNVFYGMHQDENGNWVGGRDRDDGLGQEGWSNTVMGADDRVNTGNKDVQAIINNSEEAMQEALDADAKAERQRQEEKARQEEERRKQEEARQEEERRKQESVVKAKDKTIEDWNQSRKEIKSYNDSAVGESLEAWHESQVEKEIEDEKRRAQANNETYQREDEEATRARLKDEWENGGREQAVQSIQGNIDAATEAMRMWNRHLIKKGEKQGLDGTDLESFVASGMSEMFGGGKYQHMIAEGDSGLVLQQIYNENADERDAISRALEMRNIDMHSATEQVADNLLALGADKDLMEQAKVADDSHRGFHWDSEKLAEIAGNFQVGDELLGQRYEEHMEGEIKKARREASKKAIEERRGIDREGGYNTSDEKLEEIGEAAADEAERSIRENAQLRQEFIDNMRNGAMEGLNKNVEAMRTAVADVNNASDALLQKENEMAGIGSAEQQEGLERRRRNWNYYGTTRSVSSRYNFDRWDWNQQVNRLADEIFNSGEDSGAGAGGESTASGESSTEGAQLPKDHQWHGEINPATAPSATGEQVAGGKRGAGRSSNRRVARPSGAPSSKGGGGYLVLDAATASASRETMGLVKALPQESAASVPGTELVRGSEGANGAPGAQNLQGVEEAGGAMRDMGGANGGVMPPVKQDNAPVGDNMQQGRGAYSGRRNNAQNKAIDALSRIDAQSMSNVSSGGRQAQSAPADKSMQGEGGGNEQQNVNVDVQLQITTNDKFDAMFKAEILKVVRENLNSVMNKPRTS